MLLAYIRISGMQSNYTIFILSVTVLLAMAAAYVYYWTREKKAVETQKTDAPKSGYNLVKAQAYERLITFAERIGFQSLAARLTPGNLTAKQLGEVYITAIRTEFEYNVSQQIYVSEPLWKAICDMRDQQIFIIEQLLVTIGPDAQGANLEQSIKHFLEADPMATIQPMVKEAIRKEARSLLDQF